MAVRVLVLGGAAAVQNGATTSLGGLSAGPAQASITTTVTRSRVYGTITCSPNGALTANGVTTLIDNIADAVNSEQYAPCKATSATGAPGAVTIGSSTVPGGGSVVLAEILPVTGQTIIEDASGPAAASTTSATAVTTASFTPPDSSLLVALASSDGGSGVTTIGVSCGGPTSTRLSSANVAHADHAEASGE